MTDTITLPTSSAPSSSTTLGRIAVFAYGMTCYTLGVSGLMYLILITLGLVPFTGGPLAVESTGAAIAVNLGLVALFGVQHVIMARQGFKKRWTQIIPAAAERSTFTLLAGLLMANAMWLWQPLPDVVWSVDATAGQWALYGGCAFGWAYLLSATFAIDHFELFGVKQVWRNLRGLETQEPALMQRFHYKFDRHPIMTGVVFGIWCTPNMTFDRLVLALGFSAYIVLGVAIEERDLIQRHGSKYVEFARRVRTIVPRLVSYR
tara:strand:+ start:4494 stop:5279 length:786 start_codon:yes stop_codon:yes gene_type:complete